MQNAHLEKRSAVFALANNVVTFNKEDVPAEVAELVKRSILDTLGIVMASTTTRPANKKMVDFVKGLGGNNESTIIGYSGKVPCYLAASANAMQAMSLNLQDRLAAAMAHPGPIALPTALAIAERVGKVNGKEFITAYALGIDIMSRLGNAIVARTMYRRGWMIPQIWEHFAGAAIAGRLLKLNADQMVNAFGIAYCQLGASKEPPESGAADWGIWSALSARGAVLAALMAQAGIDAHYDSLEGKSGLFNLYFGGEYKSELVTADLGKKLQGTDLGFQAFSCSEVNTPWIVLALRMVKEHNIRPQDIESVKVFAIPRIKHCFEPPDTKRNPKTIGDAQMAIPFCVATAITKGKPSIKHFTPEGIKDPETLRISNKVIWQPDEKYGWHADTGEDEPAKIEIKLTDGRLISGEELGVPYGHPRKPMSKEEITEKFKDCASYYVKALSKSKIDELIKTVDNLEDVDDVTGIIKLI